MSTVTIEQATRKRIGRLVQHRHGSDPGLWSAYVNLVKDLPKLLHQHGLRQTLDYLHFLAKHRQQTGAAELLQDWSASPELLDPAAPSLASILAAAPADATALTAWRLRAERQATLEAAAFKRYGELLEQKQAEELEQASQAPSQPTGRNPSMLTLPKTGLAAFGETPRFAHLGLSLRYSGQVPASAAHGSEAVKTYRTKKVIELVQLGQTLQQHLAKNPHHPDVEVYAQALRRRAEDFERMGHHSFTGELAQRLFTAMGERGVWETFVDLHPTHGFPLIRASALKSCLKRHLRVRADLLGARHQAQAREWISVLLGAVDDEAATTSQGLLQVHDAWWQPGAKHPGPLVADIDNPHHPAYYQGRQADALDTDAPEPQPQWAVRGRFLFGIGLAPSLAHSAALPCPPGLLEQLGGAQATAPTPAMEAPSWRWLQQWATLSLQKALVEEGIGGAKRIAAGRFAAEFSSP